MDNVAVLITARMKSSRFPGKPLVDLGGKPMIKRTYDNALKSGYDCYVLSDTQQILDKIPKESQILTPETCRDGTERCMGVIGSKLNYGIYVYVQGDFPDIDVDSIYKTVEHMQKTDSIMSHAYTLWQDDTEKTVPGAISLIHHNGILRWSTRSVLEYGDKVVGLYGYRNEAAQQYKKTSISPAYSSEKIDILRWLENGYYPTVYKVDYVSIDINFPQDADRWRSMHGY